MKKQYDAVVVMSLTPPKKSFVKNRIAMAVRLYKTGATGLIIFTGRSWGGLKKIPRTVEAEVMARYAQSAGLPWKAMLLEKLSLETTGSLYFTKKFFLQPRRLRNIIILAHTAHMPKVKFLARKVLGPRYNILYRLSDKTIPHLKGHSRLASIKKYFDHVKDGDDRAILKLIRNHPYYIRANYPELYAEN